MLASGLRRRRVQGTQGTPRIFFSRKAFLQDALRAHENGLSVLEKPDPDEVDQHTPNPYDSAFRRNGEQLARYLDRIIARNGWWRRNREFLGGFATGFFFFLLKLALDLWKGQFPVAAVLISCLSLAVFPFIWLTKRK